MTLVVEGRKGGKDGGGEARTPVEDPNTLRATNIAQIVDVVSEGPVEGLVGGLKGVFFDETPVENEDGSYNFEGVRLVTRAGYPEQDPLPGLPGVATERDVSVQVRNDTPVVRTVNNLEADAIRVRLQVPRLTYQDKETGDLEGNKVRFAVDMRQAGDDHWGNLLYDDIEGKTTSPYQRSYRLPLHGNGPWDIRLRRITDDDQGAHVANDLYWVSYTELIDAKLTYPDSALVGIEADARQFGSAIPSRSYLIKGRIVKVPSNYDPKTRKYSGFWNGTFKFAWTDNPAWVYYDVVTNDRFGAGQARVDKWALYEIGKYCDELVPDGFGGMEPRFTCNLVLNTRKEAYQVLGSLSSIFRGMTYWASDQIMPVADMPSDPVKLFTRANIVGDFNYSGTAKKARHSVVMVSWNDPEDFYRQTVDVVEDSEMIQKVGWNQKDVTAIGCSSRGQANRLGRWILYTEKYENETLTFQAGADAYDIRPGHVISVSDPMVTGERLGGRLRGTGTEELVLDAVPENLEGSWSIDVVMPSGGIESREISEFQGDRVILNNPLSQEPIEGAMWLIRGHQAEPVTFRVLSMEEGDSPLTFNITALKHEPGKYALVEDGTPLPERNESLIPKGPLTPPYDITVETFTRLIGGAEQQMLSISWTPSDDPRIQQYYVEKKGPTDTAWQQIYAGVGLNTEVANIQPGVWEVRVRGITGTGRPSGWVYRTTNVSGLLVPLAPTGVDVDTRTFTIKLQPKGGLPGMQWEFWRANVALESHLIESNAVLAGTGTNLVDTELYPGTPYFYYIRGVNAYGKSDWYPVQASTRSDPDRILEALTDSISESQLYGDLNSRIDLVDGPESLQGSVAQRVADEAKARAEAVQAEADSRRDDVQAETDARIQAIQAEAQARIDAIQKEQGDRAAAITDEKNSRTSADEALADDIEALTAVVEENAADIVTESQARADADGALARDITNLTAQTADDINAAVVQEAQARTSEDEALASDITALSARVGAFRRSFAETFETDADQWIRQQGGGEVRVVESSDSKMGGHVLRIGNDSGNDEAWLIHGEVIPFDPEALYKITVRARQVSGSGAAYIGWAGVAADGVTLVNSSGSNNYKSQHYHAATAHKLTEAWEILQGYTQGYGGDYGQGTFSAPSSMHPSVRYLRPLLLLNYSEDSGVAEVDSFVVELLPQDVQYLDASITAEREARADEDEALASSIEAVDARASQNAADLIAEQEARADADSALSRDITQLSAQTADDIEAAVTAERQARTDADEALARDVSELSAQTADDIEAAVTAERQARVDADSAIASDVSQLTSRVGENEADFIREQEARADAERALATDIEVLQATAGSFIWTSSFEDRGDDWSRWDAASGNTLSKSSDAYSGTQAALMRSTLSSPRSDNSTEGVRTQIPAATSAAFVGRRIRVSVYAKKAPSSPAAQFGLSYSTASKGNSGWNTFFPLNDWARYSFIFNVPADADPEGHWIGIHADVAGQGRGVLIDLITIEKIATEDDLPEVQASIASEREARTEGDSALASDLNALGARVQGNEANLATEAQARADGDSALASEVTRLEGRVDDNVAGILEEQSARVDAVSALTQNITQAKSEVEGQVVAVEESLSTRINSVDDLLNAEYTLKLEADGLVGGIGILNNGERVDFGVAANRFFVADPGTGAAIVPFAVEDGNVVVPEGNLGAISVGKLFKPDGTPISTVGGLLRADAIDTGSLDVRSATTFHGDVYSSNFRSGQSGWCMLQGGYVEFNEAMIRGNLEVQSITVNGNSPFGAIQVDGGSYSYSRKSEQGVNGAQSFYKKFDKTDYISEMPKGSKIQVTIYPRFNYSYSTRLYWTVQDRIYHGGDDGSYMTVTVEREGGGRVKLRSRVRILVDGNEILDKSVTYKNSSFDKQNTGGSGKDSKYTGGYSASYTYPSYRSSSGIRVIAEMWGECDSWGDDDAYVQCAMSMDANNMLVGDVFRLG